MIQRSTSLQTKKLKMPNKTKKIFANALMPGDLVFSSRTEQIMLILSSGLDHVKHRIKITWIPLGKTSRLSSTDVDPNLIYHQINRPQP
jgi:hypothetical protein